MTEAMAFAKNLKTQASEYYSINGVFRHGGRIMVDGNDFVSAYTFWSPDDQETRLQVYMQPGNFPGATAEHALVFFGTIEGNMIMWNCAPHPGARAIPVDYTPDECRD